MVVALPIDRWSAPESVNSFIGHGGVSRGILFTERAMELALFTSLNRLLSHFCKYSFRLGSYILGRQKQRNKRTQRDPLRNKQR